MVDTGIDTLVLGCTHYPILMETIQETVNNGIELIDSAMWTAKEAHDIIKALSLQSTDDIDGIKESTFYVTDHNPDFEEQAKMFLGRELGAVKYLHLEDIIKE